MTSAVSKQHSRVYIALLFLLSALFMLIMGSNTSPAAPHYYGADSSFFSAVGAGILRGRLPYVDYFDMKGPYLFLIEALGHLIGGTTGIYSGGIQSLCGVAAGGPLRAAYSGKNRRLYSPFSLSAPALVFSLHQHWRRQLHRRVVIGAAAALPHALYPLYKRRHR